jgi:carboxyl-terminal processing protease
VLPARCTSLGAAALAANLADLRRGEAPMADMLAAERALRAQVPPATVTRIRNACPPAEGREGDLAAARALIEAPEAWNTALAR